MSIEVGSIVEGVVTGITRFGAFVQLPGGETGLVHISELADAYVRDIRDYIKENERVKVKILSYDEKNKRIGLSIRQAMQLTPREGREAHRRNQRRAPASFEEKLARFLKESDERQADLKKSMEGKKGRRSSRAW